MQACQWWESTYHLMQKYSVEARSLRKELPAIERELEMARGPPPPLPPPPLPPPMLPGTLPWGPQLSASHSEPEEVEEVEVEVEEVVENVDCMA